jgi:hypothetical protein
VGVGPDPCGDLTGFANAFFITDAFTWMIVGRRVASHVRAEMVLDARRWRVGGHLSRSWVSYSDAGSQGGSEWSSQQPR